MTAHSRLTAILCVRTILNLLWQIVFILMCVYIHLYIHSCLTVLSSILFDTLVSFTHSEMVISNCYQTQCRLYYVSGLRLSADCTYVSGDPPTLSGIQCIPRRLTESVPLPFETRPHNGVRRRRRCSRGFSHGLEARSTTPET